MTRITAALGVLLATSSCVSSPRLLPGKAIEWKLNQYLKARVELQEQADWTIRLDMSSSLGPCLGHREDGSLDMEATFTLEDGTEVKVKPTRVIPELGSGLFFQTAIEVPVPMMASMSRPKLLNLRVQSQRETFRIVIDVY
jgi:hypothetical protein